MTASEFDVEVGARIVRVREAGDRNGRPVLFFHGCPSSRLDLHLGEDLAAACGARLVSFDRPGYGGSTAAAFSLVSIAHDVQAILDELGIERVCALGQSAGSRYALAAAAELSDRVSCVGIASGTGPVGLIPGALDGFDDEAAATYELVGDRVAAALHLAGFYDPLVELARLADDDELVAAFEPFLAEADVALLREPSARAGAAANVREALRQGSEGAGWDEVNALSPWGFDVADISCPGLVWFGEADTASLANAFWFREQLDATLVIWPGEGHLAYKQHLGEILDALVTTATS